MKWNRCVYHIGSAAEEFLSDYFAEPERQVLLIAGAGFDPRSTIVAGKLSAQAPGRTKGIFFREERSAPDGKLVERATAHETTLRAILPGSEVQPLSVFAADDAVIGGREAVKLLGGISLAKVTDIVADLSALSVGVAFPTVRYLYNLAQQLGINLHLLVADEPTTDSQIRATASESATTVHGFKGSWGKDERSNAAKLWMPQLSQGKGAFLDLIHRRVAPHAVCPILPFPSSVPRLADNLIEHYRAFFQNPWQVDARDIIYASERSPVDLYRTILRIDDARSRVFGETGGSQIILSPVGSKALAMGVLMAALERDFTVMYVESLGYTVDFNEVEQVRKREAAQLVHVWLHGEAYGMFRNEAQKA